MDGGPIGTFEFAVEDGVEMSLNGLGWRPVEGGDEFAIQGVWR